MSATSRQVRRVAVVTGTRAEYGLLKPVMDEIKGSGLELRLVVTGMHLQPEFGQTDREIEADGFEIHARVNMAAAGDVPASMVQSIGMAVCGLGRAFEELDPDVVLVLGDRVEAFSAAIAGAGSNRALGHIHGGDVTRGGLDESMRHAISKLAHLHFAATEKSRERIIRMGEAPQRVFTVGAPGLDSVRRMQLLDRAELEHRVGAPLQAPFIVLVQHPVTTAADAAADEVRETLEALRALGHPTICVYPNSDAGGRRIIAVIESYRGGPWLTIAPNLEHTAYLNLLRFAAVLVGNTSSGIIESASFRLPVVNIGPRQDGRERSSNVLDTPPERGAIVSAIRQAMSPTFRRVADSCVSPYGDGHAGRRIADILAATVVNAGLLQKQLNYE